MSVSHSVILSSYISKYRHNRSIPECFGIVENCCTRKLVLSTRLERQIISQQRYLAEDNRTACNLIARYKLLSADQHQTKGTKRYSKSPPLTPLVSSTEHSRNAGPEVRFWTDHARPSPSHVLRGEDIKSSQLNPEISQPNPKKLPNQCQTSVVVLFGRILKFKGVDFNESNVVILCKPTTCKDKSLSFTEIETKHI